MFALVLDSSRAAQEPITFHDHHLGSRPVNWGLLKADIGRSIEGTVSVVRFNASHQSLKKYYYERLATLATNPAPNRATAFTKEDSRAFQGFINRGFRGISDTPSVNSKNAHYPMGGIKVRKAPHSEITRFKWTMPFSLATKSITAVLNSPQFSNASLFAMRLSELGAPNTFQVVPDRDLKRDHKDVDAIEVHNLMAGSVKGQQCWMLGAGLKSTVGMLYVLDSSKVETMRDLPLLNALANSLFFDSSLVMFRGASGALVQFSEGQGMVIPQFSTPSANCPWPKLRAIGCLSGGA